MKPLMIAFEGPDCCGKGTQLDFVRAKLSEHGIQFVSTREPGGTPTGEKIRNILLDVGLSPEPFTSLCLFCASRHQVFRSVCKPALEKGLHVLMDRSPWSSFAFQGHAEGLNISVIRAICNQALEGRWPDKVLLLDVPPEVSIERILRNPAKKTRYDLKGPDFFRRVRDGYLAEAKRHKDVFIVVNGNQPPEEVFQDVWAQLAPLFGISAT